MANGDGFFATNVWPDYQRGWDQMYGQGNPAGQPDQPQQFINPFFSAIAPAVAAYSGGNAALVTPMSQNPAIGAPAGSDDDSLSEQNLRAAFYPPVQPTTYPIGAGNVRLADLPDIPATYSPELAAYQTAATYEPAATRAEMEGLVRPAIPATPANFTPSPGSIAEAPATRPIYTLGQGGVVQTRPGDVWYGNPSISQVGPAGPTPEEQTQANAAANLDWRTWVGAPTLSQRPATTTAVRHPAAVAAAPTLQMNAQPRVGVWYGNPSVSQVGPPGPGQPQNWGINPSTYPPGYVEPRRNIFQSAWHWLSGLFGGGGQANGPGSQGHPYYGTPYIYGTPEYERWYYAHWDQQGKPISPVQPRQPGQVEPSSPITPTARNPAVAQPMSGNQTQLNPAYFPQEQQSTPAPEAERIGTQATGQVAQSGEGTGYKMGAFPGDITNIGTTANIASGFAPAQSVISGLTGGGGGGGGGGMGGGGSPLASILGGQGLSPTQQAGLATGALSSFSNLINKDLAPVTLNTDYAPSVPNPIYYTPIQLSTAGLGTASGVGNA